MGDLSHAANLRNGTDGFTSPPKEGVQRIFSPLKIRRLRLGLNSRTWVLKASTLPLEHRSRYLINIEQKKKIPAPLLGELRRIYRLQASHIETKLYLRSTQYLCIDTNMQLDTQKALPRFLWNNGYANAPQQHVSHKVQYRGEFRPRQTRQLPRAVDLKGRLPSCQSY